jgi:hypothetical protein
MATFGDYADDNVSTGMRVTRDYLMTGRVFEAAPVTKDQKIRRGEPVVFAIPDSHDFAYGLYWADKKLAGHLVLCLSCIRPRTAPKENETMNEDFFLVPSHELHVSALPKQAWMPRRSGVGEQFLAPEGENELILVDMPRGGLSLKTYSRNAPVIRWAKRTQMQFRTLHDRIVHADEVQANVVALHQGQAAPAGVGDGGGYQMQQLLDDVQMNLPGGFSDPLQPNSPGGFHDPLEPHYAMGVDELGQMLADMVDMDVEARPGASGTSPPS